MFPTLYSEILNRLDQLKPISYGKNRNFIDGDVSYLSPYISRGVISTKFVMNRLLMRGFEHSKIEKFIQELAWRDYWQQVWISKGDQINQDLKSAQEPVHNWQISEALIKGETGIEAIDMSIRRFYQTGYLHNHIRMYIASIACNIAKSHWNLPARWMYYHLLDADWASNALSWQWVAGTNSAKKYYVNQDNINKYCYTKQKGTFLDLSYEAIPNLEVPQVLVKIVNPEVMANLPEKQAILINPELPTLIYNFYNLDPLWKNDVPSNRILLLEPSHFSAYPIAKKSMEFLLALGKNIIGLQIFIGELSELIDAYQISKIYYKEHPLNNHYKGIRENRDWMFDVSGYFPSFFGYWKKCKKEW